MHTQALLIAALIGASTHAVAQAPAPALPAAAGPSFAESEEIPNLQGFGDAYSLDEIRIGGENLTEEQQVARWHAELAAGRARAGVLVGAYLAYRALTPADCETARQALMRADELGNDQAPWQLAQLAANDTCGQVDRTAVERWLRKAVTLDYPRAAQDLIGFYAESGNPGDLAEQYIYARVAAGYWESTKSTQPRQGFDPQALAAMEQKLSPGDRASAEADVGKILAAMLKRHERFGPVSPVEFGRGDAGGKGTWAGYHVDYRHECQWNLKNNCRGAQRLAYVELSNKNAEFLTCKVELRARDFVTGNVVSEPPSRQVLVGPQATRRLLLGDVRDIPEKKAMSANCTPVANLAANSAAGKCRARLQGTIDVERFYPDSAKSRGVQGNAVVRYFVPPGSDAPSDAEISVSSGDEALDNAAMATVRSGKFSRECDYGLSSIRIAFKLQD